MCIFFYRFAWAAWLVFWVPVVLGYCLDTSYYATVLGGLLGPALLHARCHQLDTARTRAAGALRR